MCQWVNPYINMTSIYMTSKEQLILSAFSESEFSIQIHAKIYITVKSLI